MSTWNSSVDILINELYGKNSPDVQSVYNALTTLSEICGIDISEFCTPGEIKPNIFNTLDLHKYACTCETCTLIPGVNQYD